jgi:hypothetical protein
VSSTPYASPHTLSTAALQAAAPTFQNRRFGGASHIKHHGQGGKQKKKLHDVAREYSAGHLTQWAEWTKWCALQDEPFSV